ncbi:MAG: type IV secretion system protein [Campylobacteraceae bacterium]|jgi:type IV secretion system protein VirB6|nr:type IV secretion system protein [Campylobacteraceae bacterium]
MANNTLTLIDGYVDMLYSDGASFRWAGVAVEQLRVILLVSITLYVLYKGYMVLAGKTQEPIRDLLWDLGGKAFILGFLYAGTAWIELVKGIVDGLFVWASGGRIGGETGPNGLLNNLNLMFDNITKFGDAIYELGFGGSVDYPFLASAGYISAVVGIAIPFFIYLAAKISILFLMALTPIVVFLRLYGFTKNVFTQWLQLILSSVLTTLMLCAIVGSVSQIALDFQEFYIANPANPYHYLAQFSMYCILMAFLSKFCVSVSQSLTHVSLESAGLNAVSSIYGKTHMVNGLKGGGAGAMGAAGRMPMGGNLLTNLSHTVGRGLSQGKNMIMNQVNKIR